METKIHSFSHSIEAISLPDKFTYPFYYTPHPLCVLAAEETQSYLKKRHDWTNELNNGKMFGVLVVRDISNKLGYLAAFSGNLAGKNEHDFFVPPIYDLLKPEGFFRIEEDVISEINHRIEYLQANKTYRQATDSLYAISQHADLQLKEAKDLMKKAKADREKRREQLLSETEKAALIRESQYQKAEYKRLERRLKEEIIEAQKKVKYFTDEIEQLKQERKNRSAALQLKLFERFRILNACGEVKDLKEIFAPTTQGVPPAGAGECAAPKLLQYAFLHQLKPITMAEFWWGNSPKTEIRHHGYFYPACKGKCEPILKHMLKGLEIDANPLLEDKHKESELDIVYEDEYLLAINKPAGMLSAPGKGELNSVYHKLRKRYPDATGPLIVHRLDMATSGLLLAAKNLAVYQDLQAQFKNRSIHKVYIAILNGTITQEKGEINLPLCMNPLDRPRQIVDEKNAKQAITRYQVLKRIGDRTLIAFFPLTGRTHQLRVHAAHPLGLHCPIAGDELYGQKAKRLYLHAQKITFLHPITGKEIEIHSPCPFIELMENGNL